MLAKQTARAALWWRDVAALLAGALLPLAFAPFDYYPLAILSLACLFAVWLHASPARAFWRGLLFGLGMFATGVTWIYISIHTYGHVPAGVAVFITVLFVVVLSLFPALAGYAGRRLGGSLAATPALIVMFPAVWVLFEWVRGWFFTGFPWLNLGYSQSDSVLAGWAPLLGVYGLSLAVSVSAGLLCRMVLVWIPASAGDPGVSARKTAALCAAGIVTVWLVAGGLKTVSWTQPSGETLRVSLVQGNLPQDIKWLPRMREPTLRLYARLTRRHWDSDLIIWPETAIPDFLQRSRDYVDQLAGEARANDTELLVGLVVMNEESNRYYNSMMQLGSRTGFYHKHHLVPFTEYLPLRSALGGLVKILDVPMSNFAAGARDQSPMVVNGERVALSICYEDAFGEAVIRALPEATLLANVSNDAWFGDSIAPHQHLQIARMRAIETGRPLLRATNTGISAVIAPDGRLAATAPQFQAHVLSAAVQPMRGMTPYAVTGNAVVLAILALMVTGAGVMAFRARRSAAEVT